ncbi:MAG: hypothetical protein VR67_00665 [Peptococcaceae bacterium BRH_c8a]|nr:MAG: hypothetical protein VR67_00665 [Peptococcaceae bacterium BRH_c8a]
MQSLLTGTRYCPVAGREIQVEDIYLVEGTCTCQVDWQLINRRCLDESDCPDASACPLHRESLE